MSRRTQSISNASQQQNFLLTGEIYRENRAKKRLIAKSPLGIPWIEPEAIAPVFVFLASDDACMVSGARYDVTGGDNANYTA